LENYWFCSGWKEISLHTLVNIKIHTVHFTTYILYVLDQHQSQLLLHSVYCDSVSTVIDANKIILSCCILTTHMWPYKFGCQEHKPLWITPKGKPLAIIMHAASHTVHITNHVLHNAMEWEAVDSIVGEWKSWNSTFLETVNTHTSLYIYYSLHFSDYLLKSTSTDANRTVMWLYTLPNQTYNHGSLGENCRFHSASPKINFQNEIYLPILYTMTPFLHITVHISL
jgi:hypothetical protein